MEVAGGQRCVGQTGRLAIDYYLIPKARDVKAESRPAAGACRMGPKAPVPLPSGAGNLLATRVTFISLKFSYKVIAVFL